MEGFDRSCFSRLGEWLSDMRVPGFDYRRNPVDPGNCTVFRENDDVVTV